MYINVMISITFKFNNILVALFTRGLSSYGIHYLQKLTSHPVKCILLCICTLEGVRLKEGALVLESLSYLLTNSLLM